MTLRLRRWLRSWVVAFDMVWKARAKKHGAGPLKWRYVPPLVRCVRYIVYGQFYRQAKKS